MATVLTAASGARAELRPFKLPELRKATTSSGLSVQVARRGPLPLVAIRLSVKAGSAVDPQGKFGLADFVARLLRRGTARRTADEINEAVELVGARLGAGATEDVITLQLTAPSEQLPAMLELLGELVREPSFPRAEVDSARERVLAEIANDLDDPSTLADRAGVRATWGGHPYGHEVSGWAAHVRSFTREDAVGFHRSRMGPRVSTLVVVGDVDPEEVVAAAERAFAGWSGGPLAAPEVPALERPALSGQVLIVDKPEQSQTQVRILGAGPPKRSADWFAITAFNNVLGGGFTSRLMTEIRVKRGLSYGAASGFDGRRTTGTFGVGTFTKTETTRELVDVVMAEVARMRERGPTPNELKAGQRFAVGLFPSRLETNEALASAVADLDLYALEDDWLLRYRERLSAITPRQATEAARRYLLATPPAIVLVGNAQALRDQVKGLGPVKVLKVSELE